MIFGYREREQGGGRREGRESGYGTDRGMRRREENDQPRSYERSERGFGTQRDWEEEDERRREEERRRQESSRRWGEPEEMGEFRGRSSYGERWEGGGGYGGEQRWRGDTGSSFESGRRSGGYGQDLERGSYGRSWQSGQYGQSYGQSGQLGQGASRYRSQSSMGYSGEFGQGRGFQGEGFRPDHRGKGPKGYTRSDERIREDVSEELKNSSDVDASNIEIDVQKGEVTLRGEVSDRYEKRCAEDCIENLPGVRDVNNQLRVRGRTSSETEDGGQRYGSTSPYSSTGMAGQRSTGAQKGQKIGSGTEHDS